MYENHTRLLNRNVSKKIYLLGTLKVFQSTMTLRAWDDPRDTAEVGIGLRYIIV